MSDPFICSVGKRVRPVLGCAVTRQESAEDAARDVVLASIALVTRDVERAAVLVEGTDARLVAEVLAAVVGTLFDVTLPDGGRQLLVRLARCAAEDQRE